MKSLASLIMTGLPREDALKLSPHFGYLRYKSLAKPLWLPAAVLALASFIVLVASYPLSLSGPWLDESLSGMFSEKYHCPIHLKNVKLSWSDVSFESIKISSKENKLLISATPGKVEFRKFSVRKGLLFEIDLHLGNMAFEKEFYKNSDSFNKFFGQLMHNSLIVKDLKVNIVQDEYYTRIKILRCASKDVSVTGGMTLDNTRVLKDDLLVTLSPLMMLRAVLPKDRAA